MWSNMKPPFVVDEGRLSERRDPFLEDLALAARRATEGAGRHAGHAPKGAHEVREVGEAGLERQVGHWDASLGEELRRAREAQAQDVLVRRHAVHGGKDA